MFVQKFQVIIILIICLSHIHGSIIPSEHFKNDNFLNLCNHCKQTITHIVNDLSNLDFQLKLETKLVNGCKYTGPLRDYCASLFSSTMFKIINKFVVNIKPDKVCKRAFLCST
ncbi:unnamed protein product [Schistosoma turkestanicum]|nr:unnamed protein product [Schistosoma turkestanicum]